MKSGVKESLLPDKNPSAPDGIDLICQLVNTSDERIIIMPGSGVRKENIRALATKTGAEEFHSSLRGKQRSKMEFIHPAFAESTESYTNPSIDP